MAMTKAEVCLLAASALSTQRVAEIADDFETWVEAQDVEATALLALLATHRTSKSPATVMKNADARYAAIENDPPVIESIDPDEGAAAGGTAFTLHGHDLTGATALTIGGTACTSRVVVDDETITAVSPAKTAGTYDVVVTTPAGTDTLTGGFTTS